MDTAPSSADLVTYTRYDASGRVIESRLPGDSAGTTSRTTVTSYFTAGTGTCGKPALAGLVCSSAPAAQPSSGNPLATTTYTYNQYGHELTKVETYGASGTVRTTTDTYDAAERLASSAVTVTPTAAGGTALPSVTYGYDSTTGLPTTTSTGSGQTLTTAYDSLGRTTSYTDANSNTSTTSYDVDGRPASVNDGLGTTSFTYDSSTEHRGLVTSESIGAGNQPSTFQASYDSAGHLAVETYPSGLTATTGYDNAGNATGLVYAMGSSTWMTFTATNGDGDRTVAQSSPQSTQYFSYDQDGRLTQDIDTYQGRCVTRQYRFDTHSNRTDLLTSSSPDGSCSGGTPMDFRSTYDQADRITNAGYVYDALGRTTTVPSADAKGIGTHAGATGDLTVGYYANDLVASEAQGTSTMAFTLDAVQNRIASFADGSTTTINHYADAGDSPAWTATGTATTRNVTGPDGNLAATVDGGGAVTLQLANLHGDIVATAADDPNATGVASYAESTEFGAPRSASTAPTTYGWLGDKRRSTNSAESPSWASASTTQQPAASSAPTQSPAATTTRTSTRRTPSTTSTSTVNAACGAGIRAGRGSATSRWTHGMAR
jgi:YD repeat-containing protein